MCHLDGHGEATYSFAMAKTKKTPCPTCNDSGFVNVTNEVDKEECVPCWSCDLGHKIEKLEARAETEPQTTI